MTSSKKYHVHDETNKFKIGDNVNIIESKPYAWGIWVIIFAKHRI